MERKVYKKLVMWKHKQERKPLMLHGARQVGKTYLLKKFGEEYFENCVYINLETNLAVNKFFEQDISPDRIIQYLEAFASQKITAYKTLIILDEIQSSERALLSLKNFCENAPQYYVASAGSLLGVAINRQHYSFPVGKVDEIKMFPFDFEEFLWASDKKLLSEQIRLHFDEDEAMPLALHEQAIELYKRYLITGGMPAVVNKYIKTNSLLELPEIQNNILNDYIADMAKYADTTTSVKIRACFNSIPAQLAKENKKFQYKIVQRGGTANIFGEAIEWLNSAGIILMCQKTEHGFMPINAYVDLSDFKLYMCDVGMLVMKSGMAHHLILSDLEADNTFLGAITENYVAQEFAAKAYNLIYWKNKNTAELDFIIQKENSITPIEVKKGRRTHSTSMRLFSKKYNTNYCIRISKKNFGYENNIKSVPLYAVFCI
jgi:predicted AAA+ superfamily ATPase